MSELAYMRHNTAIMKSKFNLREPETNSVGKLAAVGEIARLWRRNCRTDWYPADPDWVRYRGLVLYSLKGAPATAEAVNGRKT